MAKLSAQSVRDRCEQITAIDREARELQIEQPQLSFTEAWALVLDLRNEVQ